ncbi:jg18186 [Pararge aegeria aegeria]|uniref:Jg18186 protein n=1 Tax=Pararge aegeria aegeria TaxID=348720 RepID=A0A8S4RBG4_9NEOP|nr:jg18186 [Pararge aegeria aegeria]
MKTFLSKEIAPEQAGFVKGRGTREQILIVRQVIEKAREFNKPTYICFVDFSKAFDSVKWSKLWNVLLSMGTPKRLVHLLRRLYDNGTASVRTDDVLSEAFHLSAGVRQGCIVSPLLFNTYTELIMRITLEDWTDGVTFGGYKISNLRYADTTLFATTACHMEQLLRKMECVSQDFGLMINRSKTKMMVIDRAKNNSPEIIQIANCEVVQSYVYLGALITNNGGCVEEVKRRMAITRTTIEKLKKIWRNRNITKATKIRLVQTLVVPIFLYSAETWTLREVEKRKIDALEMWFSRRMLGVSWNEFRTNISFIRELDIKQRLSTFPGETTTP